MARKLVILGDSISTGNGTALPWCARLVALPVGWVVVNLAQASRTLIDCASNNTGSTNSVLSHISDLATHWDAALPFVVVLFAGTNDAYFEGPSIQAGSKPSMVSRVAQVLAALHAAYPGARVIGKEPLPRGATNFATSPAWAGSATPFNASLADLSTAIRSGGFDATWDPNREGAFNSPDSNAKMPDTCHPDNYGHGILAALADNAGVW